MSEQQATRAGYTNWDAKPVKIVGIGESALPERHCGNSEVMYFAHWNGVRGAYRCVKCGQRFRLRRPRGYEPPLGSFYD